MQIGPNTLAGAAVGGIAIRVVIWMLDRETMKEAVEIPLIEAAPDQRKALESNRMKQRGRKCLN